MSATTREVPGAMLVDDDLDRGIRITLERRLPTPRERHREPVTFGIPLPKGAAAVGHSFSLIGADLRPVPTQTRTLDRWSDGSVRWLLVDAQVDSSEDQEEYRLKVGDAPLDSQIVLDNIDGVVTVSTGAAEFRMCSGIPGLFENVTVAGQPAIDALSTGLCARTDQGVCRTSLSRIWVEEEGPLRTVARIDGQIASPTGEPLLDLTVRLHFFAASAVVRMLVTVCNPRRAEHRDGFWDLGDKGSVYLKDLSLSISLPPTLVVRSSAISVDASASFEAISGGLLLYQDSSGGEHWDSSNHINRLRKVPNTFRGYRLQTPTVTREGLRATPIVRLDHDGGYIAATMPHFWQNFPKAIEATPQSIVVRLFPKQYADLHEIQGGEQKTHELFVAFGRDRVAQQPLEWCRARLVPRADASWYCRSDAIPYLTPFAAEADRPRAALIESAISGTQRFEVKREVIDEYGWRHFGDIYGDHEAVRQPGLVSHYNNQYDPLMGFAWQFLRSGDTRWWTQMEELARHVVDIDVYHTDRDKVAYNHGLFWHTYHYGDADTAGHRTYPRAGARQTSGGGPSGEHNYTSGLTLHYFLTGDPISQATVINSGQYVIDADDGSKTIFRWLDSNYTGFPTSSGLMGYQGPGRGSGNSLNALLDAFRLSGDRRILEKAEQVIRRCIHPEDDVPAQHLLDAERKWFYTMFLQALGKYLDDKAERSEFDAMYAYGRASLLRYVGWMAAHECPTLDHPERLEFPTETWAAQDIRKSDVFYFAAKHSKDAEHERFRERGTFFYRYATDTLREMPTHTLARPVIVLLTSGALHAWFEEHRDVGAARPDLPASFGKPSLFVPQRARATRRAVVILGSAALLLTAAVAFNIILPVIRGL